MTQPCQYIPYKEIRFKWDFCNVVSVFSAFWPLLSCSCVFQDLDVKSLLLEAYVKGQQELLYVVPFVAKVLESSVRSVVSDFVLTELFLK